MSAPNYSKPLCKALTTAVLLTVIWSSGLLAQTQSKPEESRTVQLQDLKTKLNELLTQYTEFHPEVVGLRQQIRLLEEGRGTIPTTNAVTEKVSPPSHNPVTETALNQKEAVSNAPPASPVTPPTSNAESASRPASATTTSIGEVKTVTPAPSTPTVQVAPTPSSGQLTESARLTNVQSKKGTVFSPLPPDLAPTNQTLKANLERPDANKSMATLDDKHRFAIGDRISFRILEDEEESKSLVVADSGEVELPNSLGRFTATGKSCKELARIIKTELEKEYYYQATVMLAVDLMARSRGKVYIVGPVRVPGPQDIPSDEQLTLSKAILRAGDFTDFADKKRVKVTRKSSTGDDETFIVNVGEILEKGRKDSDLLLQSDDLIYVQERLIRF